MKIIDLKGITYITPIKGTQDWYYGNDYVHGDLYEAEELYNDKKEILCNRLVLVKYPEGIIREPILLHKNQYFGNVVYDNDRIIVLYVDFEVHFIYIVSYNDVTQKVSTIAKINIEEVKSCYNLMLDVSPLFLSRDDNQGVYQIIWPEKSSFKIEKTETIFKREKDKLLSSIWYEDPDYHEELLIRKYPTGEMIERKQGTLLEMPDGQQWLLK